MLPLAIMRRKLVRLQCISEFSSTTDRPGAVPAGREVWIGTRSALLRRTATHQTFTGWWVFCAPGRLRNPGADAGRELWDGRHVLRARAGDRLCHRGSGRGDRSALHPAHAGRWPPGRVCLRAGSRDRRRLLRRRGGSRSDGDLVGDRRPIKARCGWWAESFSATSARARR